MIFEYVLKKNHSFKLKISSNHIYIFFSFWTRARYCYYERKKNQLNFRLVFNFFCFFLLLYVFQFSGKKNSFCYNVKIKNDLKKKINWNAPRNIFFCKLILRIKILKNIHTTWISYNPPMHISFFILFFSVVHHFSKAHNHVRFSWPLLVARE